MRLSPRIDIGLNFSAQTALSSGCYDPPPYPIEKSSMSDLPPLPSLTLGRYRHFKGGEYEVIGLARSSETLEALVLYKPLYGDLGVWARPYAMFVEQVTVDGVSQPRFAYQG